MQVDVVRNEDGWLGIYAPLKNLSVDTLIRILYIGYEVEQTPEEKIIDAYEESERRAYDGSEYHDGFADGISYTLNTLDKKIKGINDWNNKKP